MCVQQQISRCHGDSVSNTSPTVANQACLAQINPDRKSSVFPPELLVWIRRLLRRFRSECNFLNQEAPRTTVRSRGRSFRSVPVIPGERTRVKPSVKFDQLITPPPKKDDLLWRRSSDVSADTRFYLSVIFTSFSELENEYLNKV